MFLYIDKPEVELLFTYISMQVCYLCMKSIFSILSFIILAVQNKIHYMIYKYMVNNPPSVKNKKTPNLFNT